MQTPIEQARKVFRSQSGLLRSHSAIAAGVHPRTLRLMCDQGEIQKLARGIYRMANLPPLGNPDLAIVGKRVPKGVICLISALAFHEMTNQIPHVVHLALPRTSRTPKLDHPPVEVYRFSNESFHAGMETHSMDGIGIRVYCPEKTLADCFKYRNKLGLELCLQALKDYCRKPKAKPQRVLEFARICRVEHTIRPYLEAIA